MPKRNAKRFFALPMIAAAILGPIMFGGYIELRDAWTQQGPGYSSSGEDDPELVSEDTYKRRKYTTGVVLMGIGVAGWIIVASAYKIEAKKPHDPG